MPYLPDVNTYLHQSSLLIQAYPTTTRITTKYSLPRKPRSDPPSNKPTTTTTESAPTTTEKPHRERLPPSSILTLKTFEPASGICLKYKTDKAAEVGRLMTGLGRLAAGEVVEMPTAAASAAQAQVEDKMDIDETPVVNSGTATPRVEEAVGKVPAQGQGQGAGKGGKKKKKGGKK